MSLSSVFLVLVLIGGGMAPRASEAQSFRQKASSTCERLFAPVRRGIRRVEAASGKVAARLTEWVEYHTPAAEIHDLRRTDHPLYRFGAWMYRFWRPISRWANAEPAAPVDYGLSVERLTNYFAYIDALGRMMYLEAQAIQGDVKKSVRPVDWSVDTVANDGVLLVFPHYGGMAFLTPLGSLEITPTALSAEAKVRILERLREVYGVVPYDPITADDSPLAIRRSEYFKIIFDAGGEVLTLSRLRPSRTATLKMDELIRIWNVVRPEEREILSRDNYRLVTDSFVQLHDPSGGDSR